MMRLLVLAVVTILIVLAIAYLPSALGWRH